MLTVGTTSGDLAFDLTAGRSRVRTHTVSGDVTVRVPSGTGYAVSSRSVCGTVVVDGDLVSGARAGRAGTARGGNGDLDIAARSVSGDVIVLSAPGDGADRRSRLMSPVFGHGQLRLYLLSLLADGPRHGYDVIRNLEDRSQGLYSPSAGTVYPRLAKPEEEGLVERADEGRKAMYRITAAGLREVQGRQGDLADLEADLDDSLRELADDLRHRVRSSAKDLRAELKEAASQARRSARIRARRQGWPAEPDNPPG